MKKIFLSLYLISVSVILFAQHAPNRTVQTIIADVVSQMPAGDQRLYNQQMADLASTGEEGTLLLIQMLQPVEIGSNAAVEYALSGLTRYVMEAGREDMRQTVEHAYIKGLEKLSDTNHKKFIISQLQVCGTDTSVPVLGKLVNNKEYAASAAQALSAIGTPQAEHTLQYAAGSSKDAQIALNEIKKKRGEVDGVTGSTQKVKQTDVHLRIAELQTHIMTAGNKINKRLMNALKDPSREYRNAALNFVSPVATAGIYTDLLKYMSKASLEVQTDILNWIGREAVCPEKNQTIKTLEIRSGLFTRDLIVEQVKKGNDAVKEAAVWALVKIGDESVVPVLADLLTSESDQTRLLGKKALFAFPGEIASAVAGVIPMAPDAGKMLAVEVLANRKSNARINDVLELICSGSPDVRSASYAALKDLVVYENWDMLCGLLETAAPDGIISLQQAAIVSVSSLPVMERFAVIDRRMAQAGENKKHLYYRILASTVDPQALPILVEGFQKGGKETKEAAFDALLTWKDIQVMDELFGIASGFGEESYKDRALNAYIDLASDASLSPENQLIRLRKAMEIARTDIQKNSILKKVEKTGTFQALIYAGSFMEQKAVQQMAANAVMNIALSHPAYTGTVVKDLLEQVARILDNPDAEYQREAIRKHLNEMPEEDGFVSLFNGKDLTGWKGLVENPIKRTRMSAAQLAKAQFKADEQMRKDWKVENGCLVFDGTGYDNLCTVKEYADIEMYVDWMLDPAGPDADGGIYLRGTPQVQIWDIARVNVGAQVGSGGLYNNQTHPGIPLKVADNKMGEWNTFYIKIVGDRVTVKLNGELVTDDIILENFWDRNLPLFAKEQIELQAHGSKVYYRDIYVREIPTPEPYLLTDEEKKEGYRILFDGTNMHHWTGNIVDYTIEEGCISLTPSRGSGGNLYTKEEFGDFVIRFEFQLTPAANNGLGIRTPMKGDAAYVGMELQILDNEHPVYKDLDDYQYHGSVYGIIPAERGYLKPVGEWNYQEVMANGDHIKITLNGHVILDGNIREAVKNGTPDGKEHPGLFNKKGHIAFLGHGSPVKFRHIRVKELK